MKCHRGTEKEETLLVCLCLSMGPAVGCPHSGSFRGAEVPQPPEELISLFLLSADKCMADAA